MTARVVTEANSSRADINAKAAVDVFDALGGFISVMAILKLHLPSSSRNVGATSKALFDV